MNSITPRNDKGQRHGYWAMYYDNGAISRKGNYFNGDRIGYWKFYWYTKDTKHNIRSKRYYII